MSLVKSQKFTCTKCKEEETFNFAGEEAEIIKRDKVCFGCAYWTLKVELKDDQSSVRIDGVQYFIGSEINKAFSGFGGHEFNIRFFDGRLVKTNNLWHNGTIPAQFRTKLTDNAEFLDK